MGNILGIILALVTGADDLDSARPRPQDTTTDTANFRAFSKFDFVPGATIVAFDDFTHEVIGDFPATWNTDGSGEVVTLAGRAGRWLKITRGGYFTPEFITELPDAFTLEFDVTVPPAFEGVALDIALAQLEDVKQPAGWQTAPHVFLFTVRPGPAEGASTMTSRQDSDTAAANQATTAQLATKGGTPIHISVWRQRQRVRVYINQEKVWDVPRGLAASAKLNSLILHVSDVETNHEYFLTNIRVATGAADARNKILSEGRWVSHGILFDVSSDRVRPESYGSLKEIAGVLTENTDLRVLIVGHTDADGDAVANLELSRRRAASVKAILAREFGIEAGRLDTDGRGETQPIDKNDTAAGKANNRRVEFIRK